MGQGLPVILICMLTTIPFYYLIYQEYYTGVLNLPFLSGPDDSTVMVFFLALYTAYRGSEQLWASNVDLPFELGEMRTSHAAIYLIVVLEVISVLYSVFQAIW